MILRPETTRTGWLAGVVLCLSLPLAAAETVTDEVAGTAMTIESVALAGGGYMTRTEISWDLFDVYRFGLEDAAVEGVDAISGPTKPYLLPDEGFGHAGHPALAVTQKSAEAFAAWLSLKTGQQYRLPTEQEWLDTCEAGAGQGLEPLGDYAWYWDNANDITGPLAAKKPDALGLFDMLGNVAELVVAENGKPTIRGGSYRTDAADLDCNWRKTYTSGWNATDPQFPKSEWWYSDGPFIGFRLIRE